MKDKFFILIPTAKVRIEYDIVPHEGKVHVIFVQYSTKIKADT